MGIRGSSSLRVSRRGHVGTGGQASSGTRGCTFGTRAPAETCIRGSEVGLDLVESLGAFRSPCALPIPWHSHRAFELLMLIEGVTVYEFSPKTTLELPGWHFLVVPPEVRHRGLHDVRMPATLCGIVFDPRRKGAGRNTSFTRRDLEWIGAELKAGALRVHPMGAELRRLAMALHRELRARAEGRNDETAGTAIRLLTCSALFEAARQLTAAQRDTTENAAAQAVEYLKRNYSSPLDVEELTRRAGGGRARFFELFKRSTGTTPNDYLQRLRMSKAREWLMDPKRPITKIAHGLGFSSSQYFCNVFRKYSGTTPSGFRRDHCGV